MPLINPDRWKSLDRMLGFDRHPTAGHGSDAIRALHEEERAREYSPTMELHPLTRQCSPKLAVIMSSPPSRPPM